MGRATRYTGAGSRVSHDSPCIREIVDPVASKYERVGVRSTDSRYPLFRWWRSQSLVPEATGIEWTVCYRFPSPPTCRGWVFLRTPTRLYIELVAKAIVRLRFCRPFSERFNDYTLFEQERFLIALARAREREQEGERFRDCRYDARKYPPTNSAAETSCIAVIDL